MCTIFALLCFALAFPALARPMRTFSLDELVKQAEVLLTGEVVETAVVEAIPPEKTHWKSPLVRMRATIRVLRLAPKTGQAAPEPGGTITVGYEALDPKKPVMMVNGPMFPQLAAGEIYVFPLRKAAKEKQAEWELLHEEDSGLLVPAAKTPLREEAALDNKAFLVTELASAFTHGECADIYRAGQYGMDYLLRSDAGIPRLVEEAVKDDRERWRQIAVATYCASGMERPALSALAQGKNADFRAFYQLVITALSHLDPAQMDEQLIATALDHASVHNWGTAGMLAQNYPRHPATMKRLTEMLDQDAPGALYIAQYLIKTKDHPLVPPAVAAAVRKVKGPDEESGDFRAACELIRDYGDAGAFAVLLGEITVAKEADPERYRMFWSWCAYSQSGRAVALCSVYIDDRREFSKNDRFCDRAAWELQRVTGVDFGMKADQTPAQRDAAVQRARAWLEKQKS
ncbi:MAG: hypothetical protein ACYDCO_08115 [Armatimonadota bacterium]